MHEQIVGGDQFRDWAQLNEDEKFFEKLRATSILREQAKKHVPPAKPDSMFSLIERPNDYCQDFTQVYFPANEDASLESIYRLSSLALRSSERLDDLLEQISQSVSELEKARQKVLAGETVGVITNHGELLDLAMALTATTHAMDDPQLISKNRIMVGPIVKELEISGWETTKILQEGAGVLLGFPDTESTKTSGIHPGVINLSNVAMPRLLTRQIKQEGLLIYMAASGSTDDVSVTNGKIGQIRMKPVSPATEAIAERQMDWLLPVVVSLHQGQTGARVGKLQKLSADYSVHDFMERQVVKLYREASGVEDISYIRPAETMARKRKQRKLAGIIGSQVSENTTSLQNCPE